MVQKAREIFINSNCFRMEDPANRAEFEVNKLCSEKIMKGMMRKLHVIQYK
jgi:hypothetical protein